PRRREEDKDKEEWRHVLPLRGNSRRREEGANFSSHGGTKAQRRRRFFCLTRSREGAKKTKTRKNGGMSCRR
ncbi:MAG TPA: hypothetical protein PLE35_02905, partial [Lentisphaeria bacterium]|nr:hypothetical protein [Lentisphaeria bacterium]